VPVGSKDSFTYTSEWQVAAARVCLRCKRFAVVGDKAKSGRVKILEREQTLFNNLDYHISWARVQKTFVLCRVQEQQELKCLANKHDTARIPIRSRA